MGIDEILLEIISIHSPHAGRDTNDLYVLADVDPISIHSPHAGRDLPKK